MADKAVKDVKAPEPATEKSEKPTIDLDEPFK